MSRVELTVPDQRRQNRTSQRVSQIAFITAVIPAYKLWIYRELDGRFGDRFFALHGNERADTVPVDVRQTGLQNDVRVDAIYFDVFGLEIVWLGSLSWYLKNRPGTIILQDGARILSNYPLHAIAKLLGTRVLYYGHGANRQARTTRSRFVARATEWLRRWYLNLSDGVIVYSDSIRKELLTAGFSRRIFVAPNMVDTSEAMADLASIASAEVERFRLRHGIRKSDRVIVTIGRLVGSKRTDQFIEVVKKTSLELGDQVVGIVIGDGPDREQLERMAAGARVIFLGHQERQALRIALLTADLMYLPGPVGLAIVEAFCAGLPIVCHAINGHGPEIDYLQDGVNGSVVEDTGAPAAATYILELFRNSAQLKSMAIGAGKTAQTYLRTELMIEGFVSALEAHK